MAYTDATKIADYMQVTFTTAQATAAGNLSQIASDWVDNYTARSWDASVTDEQHSYYEVVGLEYLQTYKRPVATLGSVAIHEPGVGGAVTVLTAGVDYELVNGVQGLIRITPYHYGDVVMSYTTATVPIEIVEAATMLAAHWMQFRLHPEMQRISFYAADQSVQIRYRGYDVPVEVLDVLKVWPKGMQLC